MYRFDESAPRADMTSAPSATAQEPQATRSYTISRSAATRPTMHLMTRLAGRHSRALQLSWVGLVRR